MNVQTNSATIELWATAALQASQEAMQRLHAKGIPSHFLQDGQLMQEQPDGSVAVIEATAPIVHPSAALS